MKKREAEKKRGHSNTTSENETSIRLDKWVWAARFCKTRSIARDLIQAGKITYNGQRTKPSRLVEIGAELKIPAGFDTKTVTVRHLSDKRVSAALASEFYCETEESLLQRARNAEARKLSVFHSPRPDSRPDKKQRRQIIKFKNQ
ncbi:RNA-binding S4 domain-containing protein [Glaciecola siphonariae]|uniref:Heat shock protein 15 n=1 Tax=Glaciecola siphonariae TaxID=521012 RepID=A0ABV9LQW8_9ALTE